MEAVGKSSYLMKQFDLDRILRAKPVLKSRDSLASIGLRDCFLKQP